MAPRPHLLAAVAPNQVDMERNNADWKRLIFCRNWVGFLSPVGHKKMSHVCRGELPHLQTAQALHFALILFSSHW